MDLGFYTISFSWLPDFLYMSPLEIMWWFFSSGGWIAFAIFFIWAAKELWLDWRQTLFFNKLEFVFLAIDVPKENRQSPKAIEHIFNQLWGTFAEPTPREKWWDGTYILNYSLEIVSIEGYIQYIVRVPKKFRNVIEAAFYAQYPDAEITEIRDYTQDFDVDFREKGYNLWGTQIAQTNSEHYPIRTYPQFEHTMTQQYADPLAAMLELFGKLGPGEQLWWQINIRPAKDTWKDEATKVMNKILGIKEGWQKSRLDKIIESPLVAMERMGDFIFNRPASTTDQSTESTGSQFMHLPPHVQDTVKGMALKASKTGFKTKMRMIYLGKNEVFGKSWAVPGFFGVLRQFAGLYTNAFKPAKYSKTSSATWLKFVDRIKIRQRQDKILRQYKSRSQWAGYDGFGYVLNTEELATLYHFPGAELRAPTVQAVQAKKGEAPAYLPVEQMSPFAELKRKIGREEEKVEAKPAVKAVPKIELEPEDEESAVQPALEDERSTIRIGESVAPKATPPGNLPVG